MANPLDVLLFEAQPGAGSCDAEQLLAAGHRVHRCFEPHEPAHHSDAVGPLCVGVTEGSCPLTGDIDVALVVRRGVTPQVTPTEFGVTCALRAGIPVVEDGQDLFDPFSPWVTSRVRSDVVTSCEQAAFEAFDPLAADIRARATRITAAPDLDPQRLRFRFLTEGSDLTVEISGPEVTASARQALGVRVLDAVRCSERTFGRVNVTYRPDVT